MQHGTDASVHVNLQLESYIDQLQARQKLQAEAKEARASALDEAAAIMHLCAGTEDETPVWRSAHACPRAPAMPGSTRQTPSEGACKL